MTAIYTGADQGNYQTESIEITITRSNICDHVYVGVVTRKPAVGSEGVKTFIPAAIAAASIQKRSRRFPVGRLLKARKQRTLPETARMPERAADRAQKAAVRRQETEAVSPEAERSRAKNPGTEKGLRIPVKTRTKILPAIPSPVEIRTRQSPAQERKTGIPQRTAKRKSPESLLLRERTARKAGRS